MPQENNSKKKERKKEKHKPIHPRNKIYRQKKNQDEQNKMSKAKQSKAEHRWSNNNKNISKKKKE